MAPRVGIDDSNNNALADLRSCDKAETKTKTDALSLYLYSAAKEQIMNTFKKAAGSVSGFQLCFRSMFHTGHGYAFPCDAHGQVNLDALSERALNNYLFARGVVGREFFTPAVERSLH